MTKKEQSFQLFSILIPPKDLVHLVELELNGTITHATAKEVLDEMLKERFGILVKEVLRLGFCS